MNDADFELAKLDEKELEFYNKIKGLTDKAYQAGYMDGVKSVIGDDEEVSSSNVRRINVTPSGLIALLIIIFGSVFSLGMYIGGLNG